MAERQGYDIMDEDIKRFLSRESTPPATPSKEKQQEAPQNFSSEIQKKREELELKKLEIEIKRLETPNTNIDYFDKMLQIQQQNFQQLLAMQKEQSDLKLQLAKLEMGEGEGDFAEEFLSSSLPSILEALKQKKGSPEVSTTEQKGGVEVKIPTAEELEAYKKKIKAGEVTFEQFYEDAQKSYPELAKKFTKQQIFDEYAKIKNS